LPSGQQLPRLRTLVAISASLADTLNLERAWRYVYQDRKSDFVASPPVYAAVRSSPAGVLELLRAEIRSGQYRPSPVRIIDVPKPSHTTRPGGVLALKDRILYQALVDSIAETGDRALLGPPVVFGFGLNPDVNSDEFLLPGGYGDFRERVSLEFDSGYRHLLETDVAAFFEGITTKFLQETLWGLGIESTVVNALVGLLESWNSLIPIGLPQGVGPSDYLGGKVYLDRLDKAMSQRGYRFFRYSDDIRITGRSQLTIKKALRDLVVELRGLGLQVQSSKTFLQRPEAVARSLSRLHERLAQREDLALLLDLDPYGYTSAEETLEELTEDEIVQSEELLEALLEEAYGDGGKPDFELCRTCITGYRRIGSPRAWPTALNLLEKLPALTEEIIRYLRLTVTPSNSRRIKRKAIALIQADSTIHAWQKHWLLYLLRTRAILVNLSDADKSVAFAIAVDRNASWAVRLEATRVIGLCGTEAQRRQLKNMYGEEADLDVRHAILWSVCWLPRPERRAFYRLCEGADPYTDLVIGRIRSEVG